MKKQLLLIVTLWSILLTACQNTPKEPESTIEPEDTDTIIVDADQ